MAERETRACSKSGTKASVVRQKREEREQRQMEIPESEELQEPRNKTASWAKESKSQDGSSSQGKGGGNRLRPFVRERSKAEDLMANSSPELGSSSPSIHPSNPRKRL